METDNQNVFKLTTTTNDLSNHFRHIKHLINKLNTKKKGSCFVYLVIDNAENLKHFKDSNNLFLMLCKLNEHLK